MSSQVPRLQVSSPRSCGVPESSGADSASGGETLTGSEVPVVSPAAVTAQVSSCSRSPRTVMYVFAVAPAIGVPSLSQR